MNLRSFGLSALVLLGWLPASSFATQVVTSSTLNLIVQQMANNGWLSPDTLFTLVNGTTGNCDGYWLKPSDPGYQAAYAMLLTAQVTKHALIVYALDDQIWTGSSTRYCLVSAFKWQ